MGSEFESWINAGHLTRKSINDNLGKQCGFFLDIYDLKKKINAHIRTWMITVFFHSSYGLEQKLLQV